MKLPQSTAYYIATWFGIGKISKAPGTMATLATIPLVIFLNWAGPFFYMGAIFILLPLGILSAEIYDVTRDTHDSKEIVIDEVIGYLITMTWLSITWQSLLIGFILFRFLDIVKPFPIGYLDKKIQGGLGVMVDDVAAGIIASIIMQILYMKTNFLGVQNWIIQ